MREYDDSVGFYKKLKSNQFSFDSFLGSDWPLADISVFREMKSQVRLYKTPSVELHMLAARMHELLYTNRNADNKGYYTKPPSTSPTNRNLQTIITALEWLSAVEKSIFEEVRRAG